MVFNKLILTKRYNRSLLYLLSINFQLNSDDTRRKRKKNSRKT